MSFTNISATKYKDLNYQYSYKGGREGNDMINATRFDTEAMNSPNNQSAVVLKPMEKSRRYYSMCWWY
jgi:hypothetical protein